MLSQLALSFVSLFAIIFIIAMVAWRHTVSQKKATDEDATLGSDPKRPKFMVGAGQNTLNNNDEEDDEEDADDDMDALGLRRRNVGKGDKKSNRKAAKAKEKDERRAALEAAGDNRRADEEIKEREKEDRAREEQAMKDKEEDALSLLRDEKKKQDDAEYRNWVGEIAVESKGEVGASNPDKELNSYLTATGADAPPKVLELNTIAKNYSVTVEKVTEVIEKLVSSGTVNGIFDERGKFFFLSEDELSLVARFIRQRGRVSVSEVASECNKVIQLD